MTVSLKILIPGEIPQDYPREEPWKKIPRITLELFAPSYISSHTFLVAQRFLFCKSSSH